jgi:4-azaleucine resistance transporter AzlC
MLTGDAVSTPRSEFIAGFKAELPILLGVVPFGMIYGVLALGAGLSAEAAQAMSSIVFAGSAQFVGAQLFRLGTPGVVIVLTTLVVNLRHMLYSASVAPHLQHLNRGWKLLLSYLLTDEAYAVTIIHYRQTSSRPADVSNKHWYFLGAGVALWSAWQASTAAGILLGTQIPAGWALDFTLALTFIALVVPALYDRPSLAAAVSAGVVAVLGADWPYKLGLMAAAMTGIVIGLLVEAWQSSAGCNERAAS